jgi:hypothetical protein
MTTATPTTATEIALRDTEIKRKSVPESTRIRIWAKSAGRCVLCSTWLLDGSDSYWHAIPVGQIAHIVAASSGDMAPRGESALDSDARALEENLLLLCYGCHKRIDDANFRHIYTVDLLTDKKNLHERRVREVTDFATLQPTSVITVTGAIRGTPAAVAPAQIAEALRRDGLTGMGDDTRNGAFSLSLPGNETDGWAWDAHRTEIDRFTNRVGEALAAGDISSVSVFALAPIPSLVYFGSRLDDKTATRLYARRRSDEVTAWAWPESPTATPSFQIAATGHDHAAMEAVVVVNASGTVNPDRLPASTAGLPVVTIAPVDVIPGPDLIDSVEAMEAFATTWRELLALVEQKLPHVETLHVFAAVPVVAAITMGRNRMRGAHPSLVVYQRFGDEYSRAMEIGE